MPAAIALQSDSKPLRSLSLAMYPLKYNKTGYANSKSNTLFALEYTGRGTGVEKSEKQD